MRGINTGRVVAGMAHFHTPWNRTSEHDERGPMSKHAVVLGINPEVAITVPIQRALPQPAGVGFAYVAQEPPSWLPRWSSCDTATRCGARSTAKLDGCAAAGDGTRTVQAAFALHASGNLRLHRKLLLSVPRLRLSQAARRHLVTIPFYHICSGGN
jgi:hypothetical protein